MRQLIWIAVILLTASLNLSADEQQPHIPSGIEWMQSSGQEREEGLLAALLTVQAAGVKTDASFLEYEDALRRHLLRYPELQEKPLTEVLADYLYQSDPDARTALNASRRVKS